MGNEKLWDGSLQLNSAITMSAVAFFASGERLVDIKWSQVVEVKGKVRLDDFEKYVQELSCSRTRAVMVISLCAKDGTSDKELKRIKEVARGYRERERVGFARFSEGVTLYLCPQSEIIFTILANYGLSKEMTAVQGKSDSFIGCVVWRKNQTTAGSVANEKSSHISSSKQSKKIPSNSSTTQKSGETETSMSTVQPIQTPISAMPLSAVNNTVATGCSSGANLLKTPLVSARSSNPAVEQGSAHLNSSSHASKGQPMEREAFSAGFPISEQTTTEFPKMSISLPADIMKQMVPIVDYDDLPEYDYGSASGVAFTSVAHAMPIYASTVGTRLQIVRTERLDGAGLPVMPVMYSVSASNRRTDNLNNPRQSSNISQAVSLPGSVANQEPQFHVSDKLAEQHGFQKYATPAAASTSTYALPKCRSDNVSNRNLFPNPNDYMPEWLPPQHQVPSLAVMPSGPPASIFQIQQVFKRPLLHPPSSAANHPGISFQGLPQPHHPPTNFKLPPPVPFQSGPSSLTGFQHNRFLRPPSGSFATNHPVQPADGRDCRP